MNPIRRGAIAALVTVGFAGLTLAAPTVAFAEMTDPPACTVSPFGGCQDGPLGNGQGGTMWGPGGGSSIDTSDYTSGRGGPEGGWVFTRLDGQQSSYADAERIRTGYQLDWCIPYGDQVICS